MNNNDLVRWAIDKIRCDEKCKPNCYGVIGATGPTDLTGPSGGTTYWTYRSYGAAGGTEPVSAHLVIIQLQ